MKRIGKLIAFALIIISAMGVYKFQNNQTEIAEIETVYSKVSPVYDYITMSGKIAEKSRYNLYTSADGIVVKNLVSVGDEVEIGQAIMEISLADSEKEIDSVFGMESTVANILSAFLGGQYYPSAIDTVCGYNVDIYGNYQITSPCKGTVMTLFADENTPVNKNFPVAVISDLSELRIEAQVEEGLSGKIKKGMKCTAKSESLDVDNINGEITDISPYAKTAISISGSSENVAAVGVDILKTDDVKLLPGYSVSVKVITSQTENVVLIPYEAIAQEGEEEYVLVLDKKGITRQTVKTGRELNENVEIVSGLCGDERLILNPEKLKKAKKVIIE